MSALAEATPPDVVMWGIRWGNVDEWRDAPDIHEALADLLGQLVPLAQRAVAGDGRMRLWVSL